MAVPADQGGSTKPPGAVYQIGGVWYNISGDALDENGKVASGGITYTTQVDTDGSLSGVPGATVKVASNGGVTILSRPSSGGGGGSSVGYTQQTDVDGSVTGTPGAIYQRGTNGAITVIYRPSASAAGNDPDGDGYDNSTGLPNGVVKVDKSISPTGLVYQGKPVNADGSLYTGTGAKDTSGYHFFQGPNGEELYYDPATGNTVQVGPGKAPAASSSSAPSSTIRVTGSTGSSGGGGSVDTGPSSSDLFGAQQAQLNRDFQAQQAELARQASAGESAASRYLQAAMFARNYVLQQQQLQQQAAKDYSSTLSQTDPAGFAAFLDAGGGNIHNAMAGGNTAVTPAALLAGAQSYELSQQGAPSEQDIIAQLLGGGTTGGGLTTGGGATAGTGTAAGGATSPADGSSPASTIPAPPTGYASWQDWGLANNNIPPGTKTDAQLASQYASYQAAIAAINAHPPSNNSPYGPAVGMFDTLNTDPAVAQYIINNNQNSMFDWALNNQVSAGKGHTGGDATIFNQQGMDPGMFSTTPMTAGERSQGVIQAPQAPPQTYSGAIAAAPTQPHNVVGSGSAAGHIDPSTGRWISTDPNAGYARGGLTTMGIVGDDPSGKPTGHEEMIIAPGGAMVIPHHELQQMHAQGGLSSIPHYASGTATSLSATPTDPNYIWNGYVLPPQPVYTAPQPTYQQPVVQPSGGLTPAPVVTQTPVAQQPVAAPPPVVQQPVTTTPATVDTVTPIAQQQQQQTQPATPVAPLTTTGTLPTVPASGYGITPLDAAGAGVTAADAGAMQHVQDARNAAQVPDVNPYDTSYAGLSPTIQQLYTKALQTKYGIPEQDTNAEIAKYRLGGLSRASVGVGY